MAGSVDFPELDGSDVRVGIIKARWHPETCGRLVEGIKTSLKKCGVAEENIIETEVPGSFELPLAARFMALSGQVDAMIPVGVLVKGDTTHYEVISETVAPALMNVGLQTGVPTIFGVLTALTEEQAVARSTGDNNHGLQWGMAAVEMAVLRAGAIGKSKQKFFLGFGDTSSEAKSGETKSPAKLGF
jgi:6,7-dimethyl-8-ribityllumazine synthase